MPTAKQPGDPTSIQKKIEEGRGAGEGKYYKPWVYTHEMPSIGQSHNPFSNKVGRVCHLLSEGELRLWYVLEHSQMVIDCREQYPLLPLEETLEIADKLEIEHPRYRGARHYKVLTTDFLVSCEFAGYTQFHALSFKYSKPKQKSRSATGANTLEDKRALEKLEVERIFWSRREIQWRIITELDIPENVSQNIKQFHSQYCLKPELNQPELLETAIKLTELVQQGPLREAAARCDQLFGYPPGSGTSMAVVWHLLARRYWNTNLTKLVDPSQPLELTNINLDKLGEV